GQPAGSPARPSSQRRQPGPSGDADPARLRGEYGQVHYRLDTRPCRQARPTRRHRAGSRLSRRGRLGLDERCESHCRWWRLSRYDDWSRIMSAVGGGGALYYPGAHLAEMGQQPALVGAATGAAITYAALDEGANQLAWALKSMGLE